MARSLPGITLALAAAVAALGVGEARAQQPAPVAARPPIQLASPVACAVGATGPCYVQAYVDHDPGKGARDLACGMLSTDGSVGTLFAVADPQTASQGVEVQAAADGIVRHVQEAAAESRTGQPGSGLPPAGRAPAKGDAARGAGRPAAPVIDTVLVDHGQGWTTSYSHLLAGSIRVRAGQRVRRGDALAQMGQPTVADQPHVLFELRHQHRAVDPFLGLQPVGGKQPACPPKGLRKALPGPGLWSAEANLAYVPVGIIAAGFATEEPEEGRVAAGLYGAQTLRRDAPALVLWAYVFGTQPGDTLSLGFSGPNGDPSVQQTLGFKTPTARAMRFVGDRLGAGLAWPVGSYRGQVTLKRGGDGALAVSRSLLVQ